MTYPIYKRGLLDTNFLLLNEGLKRKRRRVVSLPLVDSRYLRGIIKADADFLAEHGFMDYSLLVNIEAREPGTSHENARNIFLSEDGREFIHLGIIDYL